MRTVSMLEFRQQAERTINHLRSGQRMVLTYRGTPVARLEPISGSTPGEDDPFYSLDQLADREGGALTNEQMDQVIYGA